MRKVFSVALMAAMVCLIGMVKDASATVTITLEWSACGGGMGGCSATGSDTIKVDGSGQTLRLEVFMSHDIGVLALGYGLEQHSVSLNFDTALENELNFGPGAMTATEWVGTDTNPTAGVSIYDPIGSGVSSLNSTGAVAGRINSYESGAGLQGLPANGVAYTVGTFTATAPARYNIGSAFFLVNGALDDGADIFAGLFNLPGILDGFVDIDGNPLPVSSFSFGTATIIPEPGTVSLLGLGLVGLILAGRRSRRS